MAEVRATGDLLAAELRGESPGLTDAHRNAISGRLDADRDGSPPATPSASRRPRNPRRPGCPRPRVGPAATLRPRPS